MDFPGAQQIAKRLKKILPQGIAEDENDNKNKQIPPEIQQQLQQMDQMIQQLTQQLNLATEEIRTKKVELDSKERIELAKIEKDLRIAEFNAQADKDYLILNEEINLIKQRLETIGMSEQENQAGVSNAGPNNSAGNVPQETTY